MQDTNIRQYLYRYINGTGKIPAKPNSNVERFLHRWVTGEGEIPKPTTNIEHYLNYIVTGNGELPLPNTNIEEYLYYIATNEGEEPNYTNTQIERMLKEIADVDRGGGDFDPTTWAGIQKIVRAGKAQDYFSIGDEIEIDKYVSPVSGARFSIGWIVADFKDATLESGDNVPAMTLVCKYILDFKMPLSPMGTLDGTYYDGGYSRWDWDMQRQWLNAEGDGWFVDHFEGSSDVSAYTKYKGFLSCISPEMKAILVSTKVSTLGGDGAGPDIITYDKFFTLSREQYYIYPFYGGDSKTRPESDCTREGGIIEYFKQAWFDQGNTGMRSRGNDSLAAQLAPAIDDPSYTSGECWTRTPSLSYINHMTTGSWGSGYANRQPIVPEYIRPATVIC